MPSQSSHSPLENAQQTLFQQLQQSTWFQQVAGRVQVLRRLQALFEQECPLELTGQCRVLGMEKTYLQVAVDNAGRASQLQYRSRELLIALRKYPEFAGLKKLQVRVMPQVSPSAKKLPKPEISAEVKGVFAQMAKKMEDVGLREAVLKWVNAGG